MATVTDELRIWMEANDIWHQGLYDVFRTDDWEIATLSDFKDLPKLDVIYIIDDAKQAGFNNISKLKQLHGGFPHSRSHTVSTPDHLDQLIKPLNLIPKPALKKRSKSMGASKKSKLILNASRSSTEQKENISNNTRTKRKKDTKALKANARPLFEEYLDANGIWHIDILDLIIDEYNIYDPKDMEQYRNDKEWGKHFVLKAKQRGLKSKITRNLEVFFGIKKRKKTINNNSFLVKKKSKKKVKFREERQVKSAVFIPSINEMDPKEIESIARDKMEPFMKKHGFWQKDLFLTLLEYGVHCPEDVKSLSKADRKKVLKVAKQKGTMGQKVKKFKAYFV